MSGNAQPALAQTVSTACPALDIAAIWPNGRVWLLIGSDKPVSTGAAIELTTEREIATYVVPSITLTESPDAGAGSYRSATIGLAAPHGEVVSATVHPVAGAATCAPSTRIVRVLDASGVYNVGEPTDEDVAFKKVAALEAQGAYKAIEPTNRRETAPFECKVRHRDARAIRFAEPKYPSRAREARQLGTVTVKVSLGDSGTVRAASVYRSSGSDDLDLAAIAAAKATIYAPAVEDCFAVSGTYLFVVDFGVKR